MPSNKKREFEDMSSFTSKSDFRRSKNAKKTGHKGVKIVITTLCILFIVVGGLAIFAGNYLLGDLTTNKITKDRDKLGISSGTVSDSKVLNIALFGLDARDNSFQGRADSIIILTLDQKHDKIKLTSVLRDSRVYIGEGTDTGYDKINHSYVYGGPELAIKTLNQNFGLDILDYVTVNFSKMAGIIEAFGGVDLDITGDEIYELNKNLVELIENNMGATEADYLENNGGGTIHLNGNQAVAYARIRNLDSDNKRAERQQIVLKALLDKVEGLSVADYPGIAKEMSALCETSMGITDILGLVPFIASDFKMEQLVVPGEDAGSIIGENGGWMWSYDLDAAGQQIRDFIYETQGTSSVSNQGENTDTQ